MGVWEPDEYLKELLSISFKANDDAEEDGNQEELDAKQQKVFLDFFIHAERDCLQMVNPEHLIFYEVVDYYMNLHLIRNKEMILFI